MQDHVNDVVEWAPCSVLPGSCQKLQMWMWIRITGDSAKNTMVSWQARNQPRLPRFWESLVIPDSNHFSSCWHPLHSGTRNKMKTILYFLLLCAQYAKTGPKANEVLSPSWNWEGVRYQISFQQQECDTKRPNDVLLSYFMFSERWLLWRAVTVS